MAKSRFYRKVYTGTTENARQQTAIEQAVAPAIRAELLDGRLIDNVSLSVGTNLIEHKLARVPRGYIIVFKNAAAEIYNAEATNLHLPLISNLACTISIWIF